MNNQRVARLSRVGATLVLLLAAACQSAPGGGNSGTGSDNAPATSAIPAVGEVRLGSPPGSLFDLPTVTSDATLTLAAGPGLRTVPSGEDPDAFSPPTLADQATDRLINAFKATNAFSRVERTGPGSGLSGRIYSLDIVLNTSVDVQPEPPRQSSGIVLLRVGSGPKKPKTMNFALDSEASMFSFGGVDGPKLVLADLYGISGSTTSEPDGEDAQMQLAWNAALDAAVPHIVRTVLQTVAEEEARLTAPDPTPPAPTAPTPQAIPETENPPPQSEPAPLPELEPLPDLDDLEDLPSLE